jgi:aminodeoxyfutalosine deaminase
MGDHALDQPPERSPIPPPGFEIVLLILDHIETVETVGGRKVLVHDDLDIGAQGAALERPQVHDQHDEFHRAGGRMQSMVAEDEGGLLGSDAGQVDGDGVRDGHRRTISPNLDVVQNAGMPADDLTAFIAVLPKAELHVHLVGSAPVETVLGLARRHPDRGVPVEDADLRRFYEFTDFAHFIDVYIAVNSLVRTAADVEDLIVGVARGLAGQNVRYAEVTVTPDSHLLMGIEPDGIAAALTSGRRRAIEEHGVALAWIYDIPGELGLESGERTIDWVERFAPSGSVGFGLGGPEIGVPRPQFAEVFARARALGLASVPHAGETTGPQTIREAIADLRAVRIGHGIAAAQDERLMDHLVEHDIALEVCPTSNVCTRAVNSLAEHPFPVLRAAGVPLTLNSDDPGMFDTTLNAEYLIAGTVFGLSVAQLGELARAAVRYSFADATIKADLDREIEAVVAAHRHG